MALEASCPHCRATFPLAAKFRGQTVRCNLCDQPFVFVDGPELPETDEEYVVEAPAEGGDLADPPRPAAAEPPADAHRSRPSRRLVALALAFAVLIPAGLIAAVYLRVKPRPAGDGTDPALIALDYGEWPALEVPRTVPDDQVVTLRVAYPDEISLIAFHQRLRGLTGNPGPGGLNQRSGAAGRATILLAPVADPAALAGRIEGGTVRRVDGRVITVLVHRAPDAPPEGADPVEKALWYLRGPDEQPKWAGLDILATTRPDGRRAEVVRAIEPLVTDQKAQSFILRGRAIRALGVWGTQEHVPLLLAQRADEFGIRGDVFWALGRLGGEQATAALVAALKDPFGEWEAREALVAMGPAAEGPVLKLLDGPDQQSRREACEVLRQIGTARSLPALRQARDQTEDVFLRNAADWAIRDIERRAAAKKPAGG